MPKTLDETFTPLSLDGFVRLKVYPVWMVNCSEISYPKTSPLPITPFFDTLVSISAREYEYPKKGPAYNPASRLSK